jgi:hypothetical protein
MIIFPLKGQIFSPFIFEIPLQMNNKLSIYKKKKWVVIPKINQNIYSLPMNTVIKIQKNRLTKTKLLHGNQYVHIGPYKLEAQ